VGQGQEALPDVDAFGYLRSLRARSALDGVSWVQGGLVEIAVGQRLTAWLRNPRRRLLLLGRSLLLGAGFGLLSFGLRSLGRCELCPVLQHRVHDDPKAARESDSRFAHR
jgi:hypothetical protein